MKTFAFVMDPFETLNLETETSLLFMEELLGLGHAVLWIEQEALTLENNNLFARARAVREVAPLKRDMPRRICLNDVDAVFIRTDPPFDQAYLHLTYLFDFLSPSVKQFNPARALRDFNEKLVTLQWPQYTPQSMVSMNVGDFQSFLEKHGRAVVKPLDDCSGRGIELISSGDEEMETRLAQLLIDKQGRKRFLLAQEYLEQVKEGDKRVYLAAGEVIGYVNRLPADGEFLANIHQGAICHPTNLTGKEKEVLSELSQFLADEGILLAGVDFIGGQLTEINITSPSAIRQINSVMKKDVHKEAVAQLIRALDR